MRRRGESRVGRRLIAQVPVVNGVVGREVVHLRLTRLGGVRRVDNRGENAVVDGDLLRGVLGLSKGVRDDDCDGIADIDRLAVG